MPATGNIRDDRKLNRPRHAKSALKKLSDGRQAFAGACADQSNRCPQLLSQGVDIHRPAPTLEVVRHVEDGQRRKPQAQDRPRQRKLPPEVRNIDDQHDRVRLGNIVHPAAKQIMRDLLVFGTRLKAIHPGQIDKQHILTLQLRPAEALLDRYSGIVGHFLPQPGQTIEES